MVNAALHPSADVAHEGGAPEAPFADPLHGPPHGIQENRQMAGHTAAGAIAVPGFYDTFTPAGPADAPSAP